MFAGSDVDGVRPTYHAIRADIQFQEYTGEALPLPRQRLPARGSMGPPRVEVRTMIWLEFLILAVLVLCAGPFILRWLDRCLVSLPAEKSCAEPHAEVIAMDAESISTEDLASVWEIGR